MPGRPAPGGAGRAPGGSGRPPGPTGRAPGGSGRPSRPTGRAPGGSGRAPGGAGARPAEADEPRAAAACRRGQWAARPGEADGHPEAAAAPQAGADEPRAAAACRRDPQVAAALAAQVAAARRPAAQGGPDRHPAVPGAGRHRAGPDVADRRPAARGGSARHPAARRPDWPAPGWAGRACPAPDCPERAWPADASWPAPAPAVRACAGRSPWSCRDWPVRAGRPAACRRTQLVGHVLGHRRRMALGLHPHGGQLGKQVLGRDPKLFGDLIHPRVAQPDLTSSSSLEWEGRLASATRSLNIRFFSASTAALAATVSVTFRARWMLRRRTAMSRHSGCPHR